MAMKIDNKTKAIGILRLVRPHQFIKNLFVFAPIFFGMKFLEFDLLGKTLWGFVLMCGAAGGVYVLNDILDRKSDRDHPTKKLRPIPSGLVSVYEGIIVMTLLWSSVLGFALFLNLQVFAIICVYIIMNIAYSVRLKHIAIVDILCVAMGFVFRLFVGSALTGISLSSWLVIMTFLLSLFIALGKRRDDVLLFNSTGKKMRRVVDGYNLVFIDISMGVACSVLLVAYILYSIDPSVISAFSTNNIYLTSIFVVAGMLRYLQLVHVFQVSGSPTKLLYRDRFIQSVVFGWILSFFVILYL